MGAVNSYEDWWEALHCGVCVCITPSPLPPKTPMLVLVLKAEKGLATVIK